MINLQHNQDTSITYFKDLYDVDNPQVHHITYQDFVVTLSKPLTNAKRYGAGGFVGGIVRDRREDENIINRTMITFDIDDIPENTDLYQLFKDQFQYAFVMYSTYSHNKQTPKYRVCIPLASPVERDVYGELVKLMCGVFGIKIKQPNQKLKPHTIYLDPQTRVPSQQMALPAVPDNGEHYEYYYQDAPFLDVSNIVPQIKDSLSKAKTKRANTKEDEYWLDLIQGVDNGMRTNSATQIAGLLLGKRIPTVVAYELTCLWNEHKNNPPIKEKDLKRDFNGILKKEMGKRGWQYTPIK